MLVCASVRARKHQRNLMPSKHQDGATPARKRLDILLVERALAETREKAQALILARPGMLDGNRSEKAGAAVSVDSQIEVIGPKSRYVGRGGEKLQGALDELGWDVSGWLTIDIGSSTGGFVDCLLQRGARHVIAVDAGTGQL